MIRCPSCQEENPPKFRLCGYCGAALAPAAPALPVRELRRTVTLLFSDLKGSTALGERLDAEALHEVKERYFAAMAAQITRHGGKIEKYIGDAIMAVFGLPHAHEDDALRAVRAAAGMQAELRRVNEDLRTRYGVTLGNRTGINTGEVVANDDPKADQKLATGDAVNLAARLEQAAPENEIYLGQETWRLVRDAVRVEAVEPLELKGKAERVPAWRLVSAEGLDGWLRRHDAPLVGRDEELAAIDRVLDEVRQLGALRLVTLVGDAGIGKSRLSYEVMARAGAGARVLRGRCLPYGDGITFWPLREMAGSAADIRPDDAADTARAKLAAALGDPGVAERIAAAAGLSAASFPMHELYWAVRKFLEHMAASGPLVALFDDIHWAEPALLELIENLLDTSQGAPILLLATARHELLEERPAWGERPGALRLVLRPLSEDAAGRVAHNLLGSAGLPEALVARIVAAAEGNPLYLEQILSMIAEGGADLQIPPTIKALLEARLGRLGREERSTIDPAAVIGLEFAAPAVGSLAPEAVRGRVGEHLVALARKRFVRAATSADGEPIYRFHHHLVRDTVYGSLLKRARATLHVDFVRWADAINAERGRALEFQEILGYHLEQAHHYLRELGPLDEAGHAIGRDAARRLGAAARRSFARGDQHAALNLFRRAVALAEQDADLRLPMLPALGSVLLDVGQIDEARALLAEAATQADAAGMPQVAAAARMERMMVRLHGGEAGNWSEATLQLTDALIPTLERLDAHAELAQAWRLASMALHVCGKVGAATEAGTQLLKYGELCGDARMVARGALALAFGLLYGDTPVPQALGQCERLLQRGLADRQVAALVRCKLAQLLAMLGEFERARTEYRMARAVLDDLGEGMHAASTSMDLAVIELLAGEPAVAEQALRRDYQTLEAMGESFYLSTMAALLARAVRDQGRDEEALALTRTAESLAAEDDVDAQVLWRCARAPILARRGAADEAEALARAGLALALGTDVVPLRAESHAELASVLSISGRPGAAQALAQAQRIYSAKGDRVSSARLDAVRAPD